MTGAGASPSIRPAACALRTVTDLDGPRPQHILHRCSHSSIVRLTGGLTALVYALVKAPAYGWGSPAALALFAAAAGRQSAYR